jgi:mono/diheme cytochrome c family protein
MTLKEEILMRGLVTLAVVGLFSVPAAAQHLPGDPHAGQAIAERSCAHCHLVGSGEQQSAVDGVPTFAALARDPAMTASRLQGFMQAPHPPMPDLALTRREINDVTAYILSLRPPK